MEMRFADYAGRLRISNLFPAEWCKYHFFNLAVQMIGISLIPKPGIFSFFAFQQILPYALFYQSPKVSRKLPTAPQFGPL
jgi:hypothetical protein